MYTRKIITLLTLCMCIVSFTSCSDNETEIVEKQVVSNDLNSAALFLVRYFYILK